MPKIKIVSAKFQSGALIPIAGAKFSIGGAKLQSLVLNFLSGALNFNRWC